MLTIKKLKDGNVTEVWKFEKPCRNFKEAGDRIVAVVGDSRMVKVMVYESNVPPHTSTNRCGSHQSLSVHGSKVYFATDGDQLIELDLQTGEEKQLLKKVSALSGVPGEKSFVAISQEEAVVQASENRLLDLKGVFALMSVAECRWTAVLSLGRYAVVAGSSGQDIVNGSKLPKAHNLFLLISLVRLAVVNEKQPLAVEWTGGNGTPFG